MAKCKLAAAQRKELQSLFGSFDLARAAIYDKLDEIVSDFEAEHADASERWQESDAAQDAQERIDRLSEMRDAFEDAPEFDLEGL